MQTQKMRHKSLSPLKVVFVNDGSLGIENAKAVLTVMITFFVDLLEIIKTKNWVRLFEVVFGLIRFGNIIDIAREAWAEVKDLSQAETEQLYLHFAQELDLDNDATEQLIEQAVSTIPRIYQLVLDGLSVVGGAREIISELGAIFGGEGELAQLTDKVNVSAAA